MKTQGHTIGGQFTVPPRDICTEKPLNREVLISVIADMEKAAAEGINEAGRLADNLGGAEACDNSEASPTPSDIHSRLYRLRSAIYELNRQVSRANNVVSGS